MARSKFRLFHLILEICKSLFFFHPAHIVTYTFRKIWRGFQEICGNVAGSLNLNIGFFHGALTVIPVLHCLSFLLVVGGLVWAAGCYVSVQFPGHDKLGIYSSTASFLMSFAGRTGNFWVSVLVRSSFGSLLFGKGGSNFAHALFNCLCCFSCTHFY